MAPRVVQRCPKALPKLSKRRPRGAQERPRAPKRHPRAAEGRPRHARETPKPIPNRARRAPGRVFSAIFVRSSIRIAPGQFFCRFLFCTQHVRCAIHTIKTVVFPQSERCRHARALVRKNTENAPPDPPKSSPDLPETLGNRARRSPKSKKKDQEEPKASKKRTRGAKDAKKRAQERKMSQHGPNMRRF